jgi:hypothetical protein
LLSNCFNHSLALNAVRRVRHGVEALKSNLATTLLTKAKPALIYPLKSVYDLPPDVLFVLFENKLRIWTFADVAIVLTQRLGVGSYCFAHTDDSFSKPVAELHKFSAISVEFFFIHATLLLAGSEFCYTFFGLSTGFKLQTTYHPQ